MKLKTQKTVLKGKGFLFFSLFLLWNYTQAQVIQRFSDGKNFESITVKRGKKEMNLSKEELKTFVFNNYDKIFYNERIVDFSMVNDTLIFFDKVKEIEGVTVTSQNLKNKSEKIIKTRNHKNFFYTLNSNYPTGTSVVVDTKNKISYIKSISVFPEMKNKEILNNSKIKIDILNSINGIPDNNAPILSFEEDSEKIKTGIWNIILPKIIKYPENGFFIIFTFLYKKDNVFVLSFKTTEESNVFHFNPKNYGGWKKDESQGILYKLRILQ
jgi:hypothetical protein